MGYTADCTNRLIMGIYFWSALADDNKQLVAMKMINI